MACFIIWAIGLVRKAVWSEYASITKHPVWEKAVPQPCSKLFRLPSRDAGLEVVSANLI